MTETGRASALAGHVCATCSRRYVVVQGRPSAARLRCTCGGDLEPSPLRPGVYELRRASSTGRRRTVPRRGKAAEPIEQAADLGYGESHGYGPAHGGPTGPGDAPAPSEPAGEAAERARFSPRGRRRAATG